MRMYPKEIRSLKELEQEKKRLQKQLKELDEQELFSMDSLFGGGSKKKDAGEDAGGGFDISSLISMIPISSPIIKTILPLVQGRIMGMFQKKTPAATEQTASSSSAAPTPGQKVKNAALAVGKEVLLGYLKWKAIELSYKGVRHLVNKQKAKKAATND